MRLLVTGGTGVIGTQLCKYFHTAGHEVIPVGRTEVDGVVLADLYDGDAVHRLFEEYIPDVVLHLAGNKNVFVCEEDSEGAHAVNFGITERLTQNCYEFNTRMIFFSSDYVFGNDDRVWNEYDMTCPTTQYGRDKVASEELIQRKLSDYAIVRTAGLYGFPEDLINVVKSVLSKDEVFNAFDNFINCPTSVEDLFKMLDVILNKKYIGTFHCVGPEALSRFEYARSVAKRFGLDVSLVHPESLDFSGDIRPPTLRLNGIATYEKLGYVPGTLEKNLRKMRDA